MTPSLNGPSSLFPESGLKSYGAKFWGTVRLESVLGQSQEASSISMALRIFNDFA